MNTRLTRMTALFAIYASLHAPAHAYLDPATGSIILQAIIGAVGTWLVYSKMFMAKTKEKLASLLGRKSGSSD